MERAEGAGVAACLLLLVCVGCAPNSDHALMLAREIDAIRHIRDIHTAEVMHYSLTSKYATSLAELCGSSTGSPSPAAELSGNICSGEDRGYVFTLASSAPAEGYTIDARPKTPGSSGRWFYYSDQNLLIHKSDKGPANAKSPVLP